MSDRVEAETRVGDLSVVTVGRVDEPSFVQVEKRAEGFRAVVAGPFTPSGADGAGALHEEVRGKLERGEVVPRPISEVVVKRDPVEDMDERELAETLASFLAVPRPTAESLALELQSNLTVDAESFRLVRAEGEGTAEGPGEWEVLPSL